MINRKLLNRTLWATCLASLLFALPAQFGWAQVAVHGETVYTMAGEPITDGVVLIRDGKIAEVGPVADVTIPDGFEIIRGNVVTPGLIDARSTVGLTGIYNYLHDQDHRDSGDPIQPELRALDAINIQEQLVDYVRSYGVTTVHTGHSPGELISGQTMIVKMRGETVEDAKLVDTAAVVATLGPGATRASGSPGTRGKQMAMLRQELIKAQEYLAKLESGASAGDDADEDGEDNSKGPARNLRLEALGQVLQGEWPLIITANRSQDIMTALRLAEEFEIDIWLDGAAESYLLIDQIREAGVPVILHPTMIRAAGEYENLSFETGSKLVEAGIPVLMQSGYEGYVPKVRVVLFEAALLAAHGLTFEQALATITRDAAQVLGIADRVGTLEVGKDGDVAVYTGDPFEYTTHCVAVIIDGQVVSDEPR